MGGNAFKNVDRIKREDIPATIQHVVNQMNFPQLTVDYINWAMMGSAGKKATSGDIDIAMNTYVPRFVGEVEYPYFDKYAFLSRLEQVLPKSQINSTTIAMGNLMTAWPIAGDPAKGMIQIDFIFGKADWLRFTHYSPGEHESRFKGVFLQQAFGIISKMHKDFEICDPTRFEQDGVSPLRIGRCGLHWSLELGLFRSWHAEVVRDQGPRKVSPEAFETKFPTAGRYSRIGYVDDPETALEMILAPGVKFEDVNTFEKLVAWVKTNNSPETFQMFKERMLTNFSHHKQMLKELTVDEFSNDPVWLENE